MHLDIDYIRGFRVFTVDPDRFPDLRRLAVEAGGSGARLVTIVDAGVKIDPDYDVFREGRDQHRFCTDVHGHLAVGIVWPGRSAFPDFTDPGTRSWWAGKYRTLTDAGVAGIWHDMNEPTSIALLGDPTLPSTRHHFDGRGGDHAEGHNLYGLLMNPPGTRVWNVRCPSAGPSSCTLGMGGDAALGVELDGRCRLDVGVDASTGGHGRRAGTVGVPYSGSDIGGFSGVPDDELYVRWLQMSVFMPYCRTHSVRGVPPESRGASPSPPGSWWRRGSGSRTGSSDLYTLAHLATETGAPLIRPLWWPGTGDDTDTGPDTATDTATAVTGPDVDDAFLLGDALLVAPVTEPGGGRAGVPLPPGRWTSVWAGDGDDHDNVPLVTPLERIPVLARAGSIVPLDDGWSDPGGLCRLDGDAEGGVSGAAPGRLALDHAPRHLAFHCWADDDGAAAGTCIDDAGDGSGPVRRDTFRVEGARPGSTATMTWERSGDFAPPAALHVVVHGLTVERAVADGVEVPVSGGVLESAAFSELTLQGLRPATPLGV